MATVESITLSTWKASETIRWGVGVEGVGGALLPTSSMWLQSRAREGRHVCHRGQDHGRGMCCESETYQSNPGKRRDWLGAGSFQSHGSLGEEKHLAPPTWETNINPGEWREGLFIHIQELLVLEAMWPIVVRPHTGLWQRSLKPDCNQAQSKSPGWSRSSPLQFPQDSTLNVGRDSGCCLWFWSGWKQLGFPLGSQRGWAFQTRVFHSPRLCSIWIKSSFISHQPLLLKSPAGGGRQLNPTLIQQHYVPICGTTPHQASS